MTCDGGDLQLGDIGIDGGGLWLLRHGTRPNGIQAGAGGGGWLDNGTSGSRSSLRLFAVLAFLGVTASSALSDIKSWWRRNYDSRNVALIAATILTGISIAVVQLGEYPLSTDIYPTRSGAPVWDGW
jgi:hypothetical protein